ncbi:MAG: tRNA pseudouridine(38-40) synthase TruA [Chloroflexi bacterium]|nr:tRNA pseudouridine(38-40) synthase TruA [Chloroflexota bacterium]
MDGLKHYAISVTYDGQDFCGSQLQSGQRTVQWQLEQALEALAGRHVRVNGAGRTDSGVSAEKQIFTFTIDKEFTENTLVRALNFYLPSDIAVKSAKEVAKGFSARYDAISRTYVYNIINSSVRPVLERKQAYWVVCPLNIKLMQQAASLLVGEHDFISFTSGNIKEEKSTVRIMMRAEVNQEGQKITMIFEANSFLTHQVRNMAGALVSVGLGELTLDQFSKIIDNKIRGSFTCLPPHGLLLKSTNYQPEHDI